MGSFALEAESITCEDLFGQTIGIDPDGTLMNLVPVSETPSYGEDEDWAAYRQEQEDEYDRMFNGELSSDRLDGEFHEWLWNATDHYGPDFSYCKLFPLGF